MLIRHCILIAACVAAGLAVSVLVYSPASAQPIPWTAAAGVERLGSAITASALITGETQITLSALDQNGTVFRAKAEGTYRFTVVGGAYQNCPHDGCRKGWQTTVLAFINRPVQWSSACVEGYPGPGGWDFELGSWTLYPTQQEAEDASKGMYVDVHLQLDDYVTLVITDCRDCCFWDNSGGVTIAVSPVIKPVVLVHGFQGLSAAKPSRCSEGVQHYGEPGVASTFGDMAAWLKNAGYDVWIAHLDSSSLFTPPLQKNAKCLAAQIKSVKQQTGEDVTIVAHSMGGLVSRACLDLDGCKPNIKALYTLGTPHVGVNTLYLLKLFAPFRLGKALCFFQPALCEMTTETMIDFNVWHPNTLAAAFIGGMKTPPVGYWLLLLDGPNDGVVGANSAVGRVYPTSLSAIRGTQPTRYWTDEVHAAGILGYPSYFEASNGPDSQAFRCITWLLGDRDFADCFVPPSLAVQAAQSASPTVAATMEATGHLATSATVSHTLPIDTNGLSTFYLSWPAGSVGLTLTTPEGLRITPEYALTHAAAVTYTASSGDESFGPFAAYTLYATPPGIYTLTVTALDAGAAGVDYRTMALFETSRTFSVAVDPLWSRPGDTAFFTGTLSGPNGGIPGAALHGQLERMDGLVDDITFVEKGSGTYVAAYKIPDAPGFLQATLIAEGEDGGVAFSRQVNTVLSIGPHDALLSGPYSDELIDSTGSGVTDAIAVGIGVKIGQAGEYRLSAELEAQQQIVARTANQVELDVGAQSVTLLFDVSPLYAGKIDGPFAITNVYLTAVDMGGVLADKAYNVWTTAPYRWQDFDARHLYLPYMAKK